METIKKNSYQPGKHFNNFIKPILLFSFTLCLVISEGCKKLVDVAAPVNSITGTNVYTTDATAEAVLTGIYANISNSSTASLGSIPSLSIYPGLSADEFTLSSGIVTPSTIAFYKNSLSAATTGQEYWATLYKFIFQCNDAIGGLTESTSLSPKVKQQLLGEAKFIRAFCYFYLVNLYGDVPLPLSTDYKSNASLPRASTELVFKQIIADLHDAQHLLSTNFLDGSLLQTSADRVRPTQWAATALLARSYLYSKNYAGADSAATALISNTSQFALSALNQTFLRASLGNTEAIWQLQPVSSFPTNTFDAYSFILTQDGPTANGAFGVYLSDALLNSFESGDNRKISWVGSVSYAGSAYYFPFKYKISPNNMQNAPVTEYLMMLRLGEQYLIRAEARAQLNNLSGAQEDLNAIRLRASLPNTTAATQAEIVTAVLHERQVELFSEMGQRWLDLKRTGQVDAIMGSGGACATKGGHWSSFQQLYPIMLSDLKLDPALKQNPGY